MLRFLLGSHALFASIRANSTASQSQTVALGGGWQCKPRDESLANVFPVGVGDPVAQGCRMTERGHLMQVRGDPAALKLPGVHNEGLGAEPSKATLGEGLTEILPVAPLQHKTL